MHIYTITLTLRILAQLTSERLAAVVSQSFQHSGGINSDRHM